MQLVAIGSQDLYLTNKPMVTFFKGVYRRYTNFAIENIEQTFNGSVDFGRKVSCTVTRNGDLIHSAFLKVKLPAIANGGSGTVKWVDNVGHVLISEIEFQIGGQRIDKHYGQWLQIYQELTQKAEKAAGYAAMIGNTSALTTAAASIASETIFVPLQFFWNRNPGLALPLIALQYHDVRIEVTFRPLSDLVVAAGGGVIPSASLDGASLWIDYIYLDTEERNQFAKMQHEYLIEQLQFTGAESFASTSIRSKLNFNHPVKELIWVAHLDSQATAKEWSDFHDGATPAGHQIVDAKLLLNGHDRFSVQPAEYFGLVQPYYHHTRIPSTGIYVYSFALNPEAHQPSGTVNMSRIDNATLQLSAASSSALKLYTYAVNYNVLKIVSGMGGVSYAN